MEHPLNIVEIIIIVKNFFMEIPRCAWFSGNTGLEYLWKCMNYSLLIYKDFFFRNTE
jgi:hypothetical protein